MRKIILLNDVKGDWPIGHTTVARAGVYEAHLNPQGAVSVVAENGRMLGIKPDKFEWMTENNE